LTFDEYRCIADEARALGARDWTISGGEPMLRHDFYDITDYLTRKSRQFTLKTNGTLVTPRIARLLARPGETWVSLYGATPDVYDRVTRTPGGFERMLRGIALLKEAGARVVIQAFPMHENWHQWPQMVKLARKLSRHWRLGAAWLNLSADRDPERNADIAAQRLDPGIVVELDPPSMTGSIMPEAGCAIPSGDDDRLLASCIASRREVHIDPFGGLSVCGSIKDPGLRYDLRRGTVQEAWEEFIPSLVDKVRGGASFREQCGSCELRGDCRWCPTYAYLEHGDPAGKVDYLCSVAQANRRFKEDWIVRHRRFYQAGGISLQVDSDLPFSETTYRPAVDAFRAEAPGSDLIRIRHIHTLEDLNLDTLGAESFSQGPWTVYRRESSWIYKCHAEGRVFAVGEFNADHRRGTIYHENGETWVRGGLNTLSLPVTDQILLARLLAEREGCILHSAGVILDDRGWLFIGHSEAGKTTVTRLLEKEAEILCDDRNILRRQPDGYRLYGTWSHGESPLVSPRSAPLRAALFLRQAPENRLQRLDDRREIFRRFVACLIRGFVDAAWWERMLDFAESFSRDVPCYELHFTRDAELATLLRELPL
jgi:MoaA/NifB/PqqE/SkfB family radical SAM enzyme